MSSPAAEALLGRRVHELERSLVEARIMSERDPYAAQERVVEEVPMLLRCERASIFLNDVVSASMSTSTSTSMGCSGRAGDAALVVSA
eukprot:SAG25_NODE_1722_length_2448_cov_97.187279_3_plen_88_part_00